MGTCAGCGGVVTVPAKGVHGCESAVAMHKELQQGLWECCCTLQNLAIFLHVISCAGSVTPLVSLPHYT